MDTALLKTFLVLADTKNFTIAASRLHKSQSTISLQIHRLEKILNTKLFFRDNRNVILTGDGEKLLPLAKKILEEEEEILSLFKNDELVGEVSFGVPEDIASTYLPKILQKFVRTHPKIHLNIHCELTKYLYDKFINNQFELVIIKQDPKNKYPNSLELLEEELVWVGVDHSISSLHVIPLVLSPSPCVYRNIGISTLNDEKIRWRAAFTSPSFAGTLAAVRAGLGITVMPRNLVPEDLVVLDDLPPLEQSQIALVIKEPANQATKAFADYVCEHIIS